MMAVNIDEGEPGTFKDRTALESDPHRFLEGVLIAASVVGCEAVYIYLRDEYHGARAVLERELARLQAEPPCPLLHRRQSVRCRRRCRAARGARRCRCASPRPAARWPSWPCT